MNADQTPDRRRRRGGTKWQLVRLLVGVAMVAAACSSDDNAPASPDTTSEAGSAEVEGELETTGPVVVQNNGTGELEGHTPRGFAGSGTGLFAGDNLNARFPNDDGVQIWLTFDLNESIDAATSVELVSDALDLRGDPFGSLGSLHVAPVSYERFGPELFSLEPVGQEVDCPVPTDGTFRCDLGDVVATSLADGATRVQLRLRFTEVGDGDGEQDLAMFFLTDSNTNEPGIFELRIS